jgi:hypothetical protein
MAAGYSGTPLSAKLGIQPGTRVTLVGAPSNYRALLDPLPEGVVFSRAPKRGDAFTHLFTKRRAELAALLAQLRRTMAPDAALWVSWPKKASGVASDITEDTIREVALPLGFVDVKVCAVDETWSGLKLVVRKELRGRAP